MALIGNPNTPVSYVAAYQQAVVGMLGIPAGGFTSEIEDFGATNSYSVDQLYSALLNSSVGRAVFSPSLDNAGFAAKLVSVIGGSLLTGTALTDAVAAVKAILDAGNTKATTARAVVDYISGLDSADPTYGKLALQFDNRVTIADYYTFSTTTPSTTLSALQSVLSSVVDTTNVSDPATVISTNPNTTGQSYTLTTAVETSASTTTDTVSGIISGATASTFQTGDVINGAKAVNVTVAATNGGSTAVDANNVAALKFTMLVAETVNAALFDSVTDIQNVGGGTNLTVSGGAKASTYSLVNSTSSAADTNGGILVSLRAADISGTADTINFSVNGAGSKNGSTAAGYTTNAPVLTSSSSGVEGIAIATTGTNYVTVSGSTTATTDSKTLTVTGDGANTITASGMTQATLFDMSTSTGTNTLSLGGAYATGTTVKGGTGTDTLSVSQASTAANLTVTGVETLSLGTGSNTGSLVFATAPGFTKVSVSGDTAESGTYTLTSIGTTAVDIAYAGNGLTASAGSAQQFNNLTINSSYSGSADTVAVAIGNKGTSLGAGIGYTMNTLSANGVETLNVTVSDVTATGTTTFTGITDNTLATLTATSAGNVVFGTVTATPSSGTGGNLASIDLSAVAGTSASTLTLANHSVGAATVVTAAAGGTTLTLGAETSSDSVIYTGAAGVDTIVGTTFTGVLVADGKAGADIITGGTNADSITGGEGGDTVTGGLGADTIVLTETTATTDIVVITGGLTADTVTGFATGASGDKVQLDISELETAGAVEAAITLSLDDLVDGTTAIGASAVTIQEVADQAGGAAVAAAGASTLYVLLTETYANVAAVETGLETGDHELTVHADVGQHDAFMVLWSDGTDVYLSNMRIATDSGADLAAADLVGTNLVKLTGNVSITAGEFHADNFAFIA